MSVRRVGRADVQVVRLGQALNAAFEQLGLTANVRRQQAIARWPEAVGPELAAHSRAWRWQGDTLLIEVDEPAWAQELSLLAAPIRARLNALIGQPCVQQLRFVVRGTPFASERPGYDGAPGPRADACRPAGEEARHPEGQAELPRRYAAWLARTADVRDVALASAMASWLRGQLQRRIAPGDAPRECPSCGAPIPADAACQGCALEWRRGGIRNHLRSLLEAEPWLSWTEASARVGGVHERLYRDAKERLLAEWKERLEQACRQAQAGPRRATADERAGIVDLAIRYVCLHRGTRPQDLQPADVAAALGPLAETVFGRGG